MVKRSRKDAKKVANTLWVSEPSQVVEIQMAESGFGAVEPKTVIQVLLKTLEEHGDKKAMCQKKNLKEHDWTVWTWKDYWTDCRKFAKTLHYLEIGNFSIVNILGFNSAEWFIANTGSILAGCIPAGIYTTNTSDGCHYVSEHSKAAVVCVDGNAQLKKYSELPGPLPDLKHIVVWGGEAIDKEIAAKCNVPVYSWEEFLELGSAVSEEEVDERVKAIVPGNCATLIYTSGTTGPPKAVMLSHDNITWCAANLIENGYMELDSNDRIVSYLPLSHIAGQLMDIHCVMRLGACTYFAQPDALKGSLTKTLRDVRPTLFFAVPRVYEKIQETMVNMSRKGSMFQKVIAAGAKHIGAKHCDNLQFGHDGDEVPWGYAIADYLVLRKVKDALGLDQSKQFFAAAAPLSTETQEYFASLDIPICEIYGTSECTGPHTVSATGRWKIGYCGRPIKGSQSKIDPKNGELCFRGRHIFMGYMYMPDKTAETIDEEGYLHSGDVAEFDENNDPEIPAPSGFMRITGRLKDLIITAGGENVSPTRIEDQVKAAMSAVSNCMVIGDKRKFLSLILSLKMENDSSDNLAEDALAVSHEIGSSATTYTEAKEDPKWAEYVDRCLVKVNAKASSNAQIVQKWKWLPVDFSEKAGDLTPTLKLKRNVVTEKYLELIDSIYEEGKEGGKSSADSKAAKASGNSSDSSSSSSNASDKDSQEEESRGDGSDKGGSSSESQKKRARREAGGEQEGEKWGGSEDRTEA